LSTVSYLRNYDTKSNYSHSKCTIYEVEGSLFGAKEWFHAQTVGADFEMSTGLSLFTKRRLQLDPKVLRAENPDAKPGDIVPVDCEDGTTMLLCVTKKSSGLKLHNDPEGYVRGLNAMVRGLKKYVEKNGARELALSNICSGTGGVDPLYVRKLFMDVFKYTRVAFTFYSFKPPPPRSWRTRQDPTAAKPAKVI